MLVLKTLRCALSFLVCLALLPVILAVGVVIIPFLYFFNLFEEDVDAIVYFKKPTYWSKW